MEMSQYLNFKDPTKGARSLGKHRRQRVRLGAMTASAALQRSSCHYVTAALLLGTAWMGGGRQGTGGKEDSVSVPGPSRD